MKKALIVSKSEENARSISTLLFEEGYEKTDISLYIEDTKLKLKVNDYDLILINTPLLEENGIKFSTYCAEHTKASIILMVNKNSAKEVSKMVESYGVLVIEKPINRHMFHHYIMFTYCFKERLLRIEKENVQLKTKLEKTKIISRAKLLLMQCLLLSEEQAHHYLEKQAMDMRTSMLEVAKQVIETYDN